MKYLEHHIMLTILLMAMAAWITRLGGFWLAGHIKLSPRIRAWLECLPGCILMAIVAPLMIHADGVEWIAALVVVFVMLKTQRILYAMVLGTAIAALGHAFF